MPFICLANANVPGGVLQITDLWPNESQKNNAVDPPGQTRYLRRPIADAIDVNAVTGAILGFRADANKTVLEGLAAYLADRVDPGGSQQATGTVQMAGPLVGDTLTFLGTDGVTTEVFTAVEDTANGTVTVGAPTAAAGRLTLGLVPLNCVEDAANGTITILAGCAAGDTVSIAGVVFTAVAAAPNPANQEFLDVAGAGSAILSANSLRTAINDAASQALITAALDALTPLPVGGTITPDAPGAAAVLLTASVPGVWGDAALAENTAGARITVSGASMVHTDPVAANQEFGSAAHYSGQLVPANNVAADIVATVNHANTQALIAAAYAGPAPGALDGSMTAAAVANVVTLTATLPGFSGQLDMATTEAGQLVLSGATLVRTAANPANQEFDSLINAGTNIAAAASLSATLNNAATDALLAAIGSTVTAVDGGTDTVTITADTAGAPGMMTITPSSAVRTVVSANALTKAMVTWTGAQLRGAAAAVQALVDGGLAATEAAINAAINGVAGVSGIDIVSASSTSTLADILAILSGRRYQLPAGTVKNATGINWDTTVAGSFTTPVTVFDSQMLAGEIRPVNRWVKHGKEKQSVVSGGDTQNNEIGGVRSVVDSTHFQASLQNGQLRQFATAGVTLFPDNDLLPFIQTPYQRTQQAAIAGARLVTVYDDDGSLLV